MPLGIVPESEAPPTFKTLVNAATFLSIFAAFLIVVPTDLVVGCWPGLRWGLFRLVLAWGAWWEGA